MIEFIKAIFEFHFLVNVDFGICFVKGYMRWQDLIKVIL